MKKAKKRKSQTRIAMVSITFVVGVLFVGMMGKSVALQNQLSSYDSQIKELDQQIEEEEGRTTEIDDLKEYMKTDEYVEETAREKLGLVKENEIVFKEGDTEENTQETDQSLQEQDWQTKMEERLAEVLEQVQGVGKAEVFLTCEGTQEKVVEKDETETVYERDSRGNQTPYVSAEIYPQVTGVLVVAQGGDDPVVIQNIQEAVQVLFQVEAHKIKVMKMN